jgi:hypothetical protein
MREIVGGDMIELDFRAALRAFGQPRPGRAAGIAQEFITNLDHAAVDIGLLEGDDEAALQ